MPTFWQRFMRFCALGTKDILGRLLIWTGLHRGYLRGRSIVVAFHSITTSQNSGALLCSVKDFEIYCEFFRKYLRPVKLDDVLRARTAASERRCNLAITFDDGYADNAELALPILEKLKLHATFFVTAGLLDNEWQSPWDTGNAVVSRWLSWEQARTIVRSGHDLASHSMQHSDFATLSPSEIKTDLLQARQLIRDKVGVEVRHFGVPFGRGFDTLPTVARLAHELGYVGVWLCRGGFTNEPPGNPILERWPIAPDQYLSPYGWVFDLVRDAYAGPPGS